MPLSIQIDDIKFCLKSWQILVGDKREMKKVQQKEKIVPKAFGGDRYNKLHRPNYKYWKLIREKYVSS